MLLDKTYYVNAFENIEKWSWSEIKYLFDQSFISTENIISYARGMLDENTSNLELVIELTIADDYEVEEILLSLIDQCKEEIESIQFKWIFALIYYSYQNSYDVFQVIDEVYSSFGYPVELSKLVRYMPCDEATTIENRLKRYIEEGINKWIIK